MAAADDLGGLLVDRGLSSDVVEELVGGIVGLWLLNEPAEVLADDLVLYSPRPGAGEVRVCVRPLGLPDRQRVTVVGTDCPGMLAATAGVLAAAGLSVTEAVATTWPRSHLALQALTVEDPECRASSRTDGVGSAIRSAMCCPEGRRRKWCGTRGVRRRSERNA